MGYQEATLGRTRQLCSSLPARGAFNKAISFNIALRYQKVCFKHFCFV